LGIFAILIGILAEKINVAFAVGLAFAIAASCNFPVLVMSMMWKNMTTRGAVVGGFLGLITAFLGVVLSPAVWEGIFGNPKGSALVTIDNPTIVSMTLAFVAIYVVSKLDSSARAATDRAGFPLQFVRSQTGVGAEGASAH
jgi:cation/acetate symporter